jgi:hypothetical protein
VFVRTAPITFARTASDQDIPGLLQRSAKYIFQFLPVKLKGRWSERISGRLVSGSKRIFQSTIPQRSTPCNFIFASGSEKYHQRQIDIGSYFFDGDLNAKTRQLDVIREETGPPVVPADVLQLSMTFPFPWAADLRIRARIRNALPPRKEAEAVCSEARRNALWQWVSLVFFRLQAAF